MRRPSIICWIAPIACLGLSLSCGRETGLTLDPNSDSNKLPFDRQPRSAGISPSHSLIPSVTRLPEGTPLTVCLQRDLSSASARQGNSFAAILDAPIAIDGQTLVPRGATVSGRVLAAKHSGGRQDPGYLRLALVNLNVGGKPITIETSSLFAKGGSRDGRSSAMIRANSDHAPDPTAQDEILLGPERRLSFRLAQAVDLP
ncbi:MAG TPA: hypothetical protein VEK84_13870 [Terriglobales bacterium]|nr:hypothetical protein [Terriglobales bacterium]